MAKFNVNINKLKGDTSYTVHAVASNDVVDHAIKNLSVHFETEMLCAVINKGETETEIIFITSNEDKVGRLKKNFVSAFRRTSGLDNINNN